MSKEKGNISAFQKYLTVWVILCMVIGVLIGKYLPIIPNFLNRFEYAKVSIPMALLIWLMIYPMMMKVDFQSIKDVGKNPKGLFVTWATNWLIKPFTMYGIASVFFFVIFKEFITPELATEYLLSNGGSKIALINGPGNFKYARRRQEGFMNALRNAEVMIPKQWIVQLPEVSYEMAYAAVCRLLNSDSRPNAFFTISDVFAAAVIRAAKRFHLHVPRDILVVGFDNIELSSMTSPSITTVNQPKFQMGYTACEMLLELMEDPHGEMKSLLLDTELVIREST